MHIMFSEGDQTYGHILIPTNLKMEYMSYDNWKGIWLDSYTKKQK